MSKPPITLAMVYECFASALPGEGRAEDVLRSLDVDDYQDWVMYPEFARWAEQAGQPQFAGLFRKVGGQDRLHPIWLRELYRRLGETERGDEDQRAVEAIMAIRARGDELIALNPEGLVEKALLVAVGVEQRDYLETYPRYRDRALREGNTDAAAVYQRAIDTACEHAEWFRQALEEFRARLSRSALA
jgi:rubrerythrin